MVFPNWGAISGNIINAQNRKKDSGLAGDYIQTRKPTKKDWIVAILIMVVPAIIIWILFILYMMISNT